MTIPTVELGHLKCVLHTYFSHLQDVYKMWEEKLVELRDPLRVVQTRLKELHLVQSAEDKQIPAVEKDKVVNKLKMCIEKEIKLLQSALADLEKKLAHLKDLRVSVDGCVQQLGWRNLVMCDDFLRGEGQIPSGIAMFEWVHDSCLYYQQLMLRISNTLSALVEDRDSIQHDLESSFKEDKLSKQLLQRILAQTYFFVQGS